MLLAAADFDSKLQDGGVIRTVLMLRTAYSLTTIT